MSLKKLSSEAILGLSLLGTQHALGSIPTTDHLPGAQTAPEEVTVEHGVGVFDSTNLKEQLFGDGFASDGYDSFLLKLAAADVVSSDATVLASNGSSGGGSDGDPTCPCTSGGSGDPCLPVASFTVSTKNPGYTQLVEFDAS